MSKSLFYIVQTIHTKLKLGGDRYERRCTILVVKLFCSICLFLCMISPQNIYAATYSNGTQGESEVSIRIVNKLDKDETQSKSSGGLLPKTGNQSYQKNTWILGSMFIVFSMKIICIKRRKKLVSTVLIGSIGFTTLGGYVSATEYPNPTNGISDVSAQIINGENGGPTIPAVNPINPEPPIDNSNQNGTPGALSIRYISDVNFPDIEIST